MVLQAVPGFSKGSVWPRIPAQPPLLLFCFPYSLTGTASVSIAQVASQLDDVIAAFDRQPTAVAGDSLQQIGSFGLAVSLKST